MLVDNVEIKVKAGDGGPGLVSFRREKFKPFGGPDGGDGGRGGNVYLSSQSDVQDLSHFKHKRDYVAQDGGPGGSNKMHGADAKDLVISVPVGTLVYKNEAGFKHLVGDLCRDGQMMRIAEGGKGGRGNVHFATATNKAPKTAQKGVQGGSADVLLRLMLPVDVAIIGLPNSGKSKLLSSLSGASPAVADYPFTTREPVLGSVEMNLNRYTWIELPAIVRQAHEGRGLGNAHLYHAGRAKVIVHLIDINSDNPVSDMESLRSEITIFNKGLGDKKSLLALNKTDLISDPGECDRIKNGMQVFGLPVLLISAQDKSGLDELVREAHRLAGEEMPVEEPGLQDTFIFRPKPVDRETGK